MGKAKIRGHRCGLCPNFFNPPNHPISNWFKLETGVVRLCPTCEVKTVKELVAWLDKEGKSIRTIKDFSRHRIIIRTEPSDYVGTSVLRPTPEEMKNLSGIRIQS